MLRLCLLCGIIGPLLFIVVFLIEGVTRAGYDPLRYPVSSFVIGDTGWIQTANFLMVGASLLVCAVGLRGVLRGSKGATWGPLLVGLAGVGLFGAGVFTTDPVFGYPTSAPLALAQYSTRGHLHDFFSLLLFLGLPIAGIIFGVAFTARKQYAWAIYSIFTTIGMLAAFVLASIGFEQNPALVHLGGAFQRLSISIGLIWVVLLSLYLLRETALSGESRLSTKEVNA